MASSLKCVAAFVVAIAAILAGSGRSWAGTPQSFGHAAGAQCVALDVNDSGSTVGTCSRPPSVAGETTNGIAAAWFATVDVNGNPSTQTRLQPLVMGHSCGAVGVTNSGRIIGSCDRASGIGTAVYWDSGALTAAPTELLPLPGLLGLGADLSSTARRYNQAGAVVGQSLADKTSTAVLWPPGSASPVQVSARNDDCVAVDIMEQTGAGNPTILLNCPYVGLDASLRGTIVPKVAKPTGLLGGYVMTPLIKNSTATFCVAQSMNAASRIVGSCRLPVAPFAVAATWNSPSVEATVINLRDANGVVRESASAALNDLEHMIITYETDDGRSNAGFIDLSATPVTFKPIPPLHAGTNVRVTGLGQNDLVLVLALNSSEHAQAAVWNPASPSVLASVPLYGGGQSNMVSILSNSGFYAVGAAVDSDHVADAVVATLP